MKNLRRIAALFLVAGAALAGSMLAKPTDAGAAGSTINCVIPNNVVCTVGNPAGIKRVVVTVNFGGNIGNVNVVDKSYSACPKSVSVAWDPIVPNYHFTVETCDGLKVTNGNPPSGSGPAAPAGALRNPGPGGDPKPLGLTAQTGTTMNGYPSHCSGDESHGFVLCDQTFVLDCKLLGGTWIPGEGGEGDCEGAHEGPGGSHPEPPEPHGD